MQENYDYCYAVLRLPVGADLGAIEAAWKHWAALLHPDLHAEGSKAKQHAASELTEINNARDVLRKWWQEHDCPPPSDLAEERSDQEDEYTEEEASSPGINESDFDEECAGEEKVKRPGLEAPVFQKQWKHHLYDFLNSSKSEASLPASILGLLYFGSPLFFAAALTGLFRAIFALPEDVIGWIFLPLIVVIGVPLWRDTFADMDLYRVLVNPYLEIVGLDHRTAMAKFSALIDGKYFSRNQWNAEPEENEEFALSKGWTARCGERGNQCNVTLKVRCVKRDERSSYLSYWFEADKEAALVPVRDLVCATDTALWQGLK